MRYARAKYGPDPENPWLENFDNGWGPYHWPQGVPSRLRATTHTADGTPVDMRKELIPLVDVLIEIAEVGFQYPLHTPRGGWTGGYDNRPIAGTSTASAHSRARAWDVRAIDNPQSWSFVSTWPPDLIKVFEACGFYWGGRYVGAKLDTMHSSYIGTPSQVAGHLARAERFRQQYVHERHRAPAKPAPSKPAPAPAKPVPVDKRMAEITTKGVTVRQVQNAINAAGYSPKLAVDGKIGALTSKGTEWLQRKYKLAADRYIGEKTAALVHRLLAPKYPLSGGRIFGTALQGGKRSDGTAWSHLTVSGSPEYGSNQPGMSLATAQRHIRRLQQQLQQQAGAPGGKWADGVYGQPTVPYVKKVQREHGLPADGMVGPDTWRAIFS